MYSKIIVIIIGIASFFLDLDFLIVMKKNIE